MSNIFISSLIFAIWAVVLFFEKKLGISVFLFVAPFTYYIIYLLEKNEKIKNGKAKLLYIPIVLLSITYFLYDNNLKQYNILAILILLTAMLIMLFNDQFAPAKVIEKFINFFLSPILECSNSIKSSTTEVCDFINKKDVKISKKKIKNVIKAIICTVSLSLIILCLLATADYWFDQLFGRFLGLFGKLRIIDIFVRVLVTGIVFVYFIGFFHKVLSSESYREITELEKKTEKENLTIKMILLSLNFIYLIFSIVQIKEFINFDTNSNYANFAREGFFQLMAVSFINLITILVAKNSENTNEKNIYLKSMTLIMIFFTFTLIISAAFRMNLYETAYGYTHLRFLVYFALITEAILLVPTILYVLDIKMNLLKVYFVIITIMYVGLNFINMDRFIARKNIDRFFEIGKLDFMYLKNETGTDAIPEIIRLMNADNKETKKQVRGYVKSLYNELKEEDRSIFEFNYSKYNAEKCIEKQYNSEK